jgi:UDP-GlcNAc:undecaprenyl-phosphate/decaprenyl-phosphate GlcNAc-1-phosphate transferase
MINLYSIIGLIITSILSIIFLNNFAKKFGIFDMPQKLRIHKEKVTKASGFGIIFIIINSFFIFNYSDEVNYSLNILIFFVLIGFYDDIKGFEASSKIILMIIPTILFIYGAGLVTTLGQYKNFSLELNSLSILFTFCCILLLTNAFNYIDGMDGLLGTISLTSLLFFIIVLPNSEINFIAPFIIFLSIFLFFNLRLIRSLSKVFMGDSGSLGIGFLFCIIVIHYTQNLNYIHESVAIWPIAFVVYEFLTINIIRIKNKKNPFKRDLNFIFNKFLSRYTKLKTLILCNLINLFYCGLGYFFHVTKYYEFSISLFIIFYFIYLFLRFKQDED